MLLLDDEYRETLVKSVLTKGEVSRYFPEYDLRAVKLARVAALPEAERVVYLDPPFHDRVHSRHTDAAEHGLDPGSAKIVSNRAG